MGGAKKVPAKKMTAAEKLAKSQTDAQAHTCTNCKQCFSVTAKKVVLQQHCASKHPKLSEEQCFPGIGAMA